MGAAKELGAKLVADAELRWVVAHVRHYQTITNKPEFWPGMNDARRVALDDALESGLVECNQYPAVNPYYSAFRLGPNAVAAIRVAVKAGAR